MNPFGEEFFKFYNQYQDYPYFTRKKLDSGYVYEFNAPADIYNNCYKIAREKAKYTMDKSQASKDRTPEEKVIKQFKGSLAETAIQFFLVLKCKIPFDKVQRWDLERASFESPFNEYDLKIITGEHDFTIESRASDSYHTTLDDFMKDYDIIGGYTNRRKTSEKKADFYLRPVYQFESCMGKNVWRSKLPETYKMIQAKSLRLYLVSGATKEEMYGEKSYTKNMSQGRTTYRCLRISDAGDMDRIAGIICSKYAQLGGGFNEP